ncbi:hypothetical protein BD626DRAFT_176412 [Schizophyllum amplum]|uniref:Uncharacterized protein n=1 Tax=Schizophyllum amplum TaxID=97359 RepID=A0A550C229_9AGAR|nr:hypothetical protein BD626DRAFT_176412 [Auriculariopsis ampla]
MWRKAWSFIRIGARASLPARLSVHSNSLARLYARSYHHSSPVSHRGASSARAKPIVPEPPRIRARSKILTLSREKLTRQDTLKVPDRDHNHVAGPPHSLDSAGLTSLGPVRLSGLHPVFELPQGRVRLGYTPDKRTSFPKDTRGFLYFDNHSLSVRFRVVVGDAMDFESGSDLLLPDKRTPWCIPFRPIVSRAGYKPIRAQLLQEKLVTERQLQSRAYVVTTLDPTRLTDSDLMDVSGVTWATISIAPPAGQEEPFTIAIICKPRFPDNARGFLYWHIPKDDPYGSELRFRCTESLEHFARGEDLQTPSLRQPWSNRLRALALRTAPLPAYLKQAGLVDESVIEHHAKMVVTNMQDLFLVRFNLGKARIRLSAGALSRSIIFRSMPWIDLYSGAALARLVVLNDTPTCVRLGIRIVTMLDGPRLVSDGEACLGAVPPKEGQLVYGRCSLTSSGHKYSWSFVRSLAVRKSTREGQVLLKILEKSGDDVDKQRVHLYRTSML